MHRLRIVLILLAVLTQTTRAQDPNAAQYLWPTSASKYLTSAFGEYRARRFHTGIDIKTWGKTGYKVVAIRDGYILRVSVSPNGYGKVVYLKLDTGETAVFAHLSKFVNKIQRLVDAEQRRLGKYRINLYLRPGQVAVSQGEVIAYTGQTGIGAPHLHFEIRDSGNQPINPLSKGYQIPDRVKPIVRRVSFTPLDRESEVDGDYKPVIVTPKWVRSGEYVIPDTISVWGNVGLAVRCFDKGVNSFGGYGIYSLRLFVDDVIRFEYAYDHLSFQKNRMVELERDYRLSRRRFGRFYKLYKDKFNIKSDYRPNKTWAGVLRSASLSGEPTLQTNPGTHAAPQKDFQTGGLFPGPHQFRIEILDYFDNTSIVRGNIQVGAAFDIYPVFEENDDGQVILREVMAYDLKRVDKLEAFVLSGKKWREMPLTPLEPEAYLEEKGGEGVVDDAENDAGVLPAKIPSAKPLILRIHARDGLQTRSNPFFYVHPGTMQVQPDPEVDVNYDYYDDYLRLEINSKTLLAEPPQVVLYPDRRNPIEVDLHQRELKQYVGRIELRQMSGAFHLIRIITKSLDGDSFTTFEQFEARTVRAKKSDQLVSSDGRFWLNFWSGSLYRPIYTRITVDSVNASKKYDFVSRIYDVRPNDVLLNQGAFVHIKFAQSELDPQQIGVYYKDQRKRKWIFIDNNLDLSIRSISAKILSFEEFALIRDDAPPEITRIRPRQNAHLANRTPRISFNIRDVLSGIKSEREIRLTLDGRPLIAEYDPERRRVFYDVRRPLARGRHEVAIIAEDNAKNAVTRTSVFWID